MIKHYELHYEAILLPKGLDLEDMPLQTNSSQIDVPILTDVWICFCNIGNKLGKTNDLRLFLS